MYSESIGGSKSTCLHFYRKCHEEVVEDPPPHQETVEEERVRHAFLQNKLLKSENNYESKTCFVLLLLHDVF